ncbi:MAG: ribose 5-phosphate isomerase [Phycisphaerales bacterium]|jgi:ribose 5-phosphate isomerase A|nr:ribose 5-phosphate isomerase [Phycisphaerales bacterium]
MSAKPNTAKQRAAEAALEYVRSDTVIGLGTGSTADCFLIALADALENGRLKDVGGVPTSEHTARLARELGIPIVDLSDVDEPLDVTVDGADEVAPNLDLIKGLGGALLREKIVAQNSKSLIIIADASKRVEKLGTKSPVPVEVVQFAHESTARFLASLGCRPELRREADGAPFVTDNHNFIYHCRFLGGIADARGFQSALCDRAGIVETGLFLHMAQIALLASDAGDVETIRRSA